MTAIRMMSEEAIFAIMGIEGADIESQTVILAPFLFCPLQDSNPLDKPTSELDAYL